MPHGGPLGWAVPMAPGAGSCLHPATVATTRRTLTLQQGHCITSSLARVSLSILHALANTP
ncbi:MAG: hypothetical protein ABIQ42_18750 [Rhodoferax sp.]